MIATTRHASASCALPRELRRVSCPGLGGDTGLRARPGLLCGHGSVRLFVPLRSQPSCGQCAGSRPSTASPGREMGFPHPRFSPCRSSPAVWSLSAPGVFCSTGSPGKKIKNASWPSPESETNALRQQDINLAGRSTIDLHAPTFLPPDV